MYEDSRVTIFIAISNIILIVKVPYLRAEYLSRLSGLFTLNVSIQNQPRDFLKGSIASPQCRYKLIKPYKKS